MRYLISFLNVQCTQEYIQKRNPDIISLYTEKEDKCNINIIIIIYIMFTVVINNVDEQESSPDCFRTSVALIIHEITAVRASFSKPN